MGIADKIKGMPGQAKQSAKDATHTLAHILLRLVSGFFVGYVLALILQEFFQSGTFMLVFLTVFFMGLIYTLLSKLTIWQIVIFDVICVLIGALLRMYIMLAPN